MCENVKLSKRCQNVPHCQFAPLAAPATSVDAQESSQTVRKCVCVGECDRIVVNVSLDNSG